MQLFSTSTAENRIFAQAIPDRWVHDRQWLSSNYEHKQGIPSSTQAMYQVWQNASAWNFKAGWKNQRYLPIYLWMWQLPPPVVCQWLCCNSAMERIRCDLTLASVKNKSISRAGSGNSPLSRPRINFFTCLSFQARPAFSVLHRHCICRLFDFPIPLTPLPLWILLRSLSVCRL